MNKKTINKVLGGLVLGGIIVGVIFFIILVFAFIFLKNNIKNKPTKVQTHDSYYDKAKYHLEKKYGKKFIVNPKGANDGGSPIPFAVNDFPMYYEAYAEDNPDFIFRVYVYQGTEKGESTREIRDSYCWQFLREKLKEKLEMELTGILPEECKIFVDTYYDITFDNNVTPDSSIEQYFKSNEGYPIVIINVYVPDNIEINEKEAEQKAYDILNEFKDKLDNMNMKFLYYVVADKDKFSLIDINELEKLSLIIYGDNYPESMQEMKKEKKFEVEIKTIDKVIQSDQ